MPVKEGYLGDWKVQVMRDTGCSSAAVKGSLVTEDQLTGRVHWCRLGDGTIGKFPIAKIRVESPFYTGDVEAMCMKTPLTDIMICNIPGTTKLEESGEVTKKATEATQTDECAAVTTRAQAKCDKQSIKPLKVAESEIPDLTPQNLQEAQKGDKSLEKLFESAKQKTMHKTKGKGKYHFEERRGVLYHIYQGRSNSVVKQIAVPEQYRIMVMKLAHESIVGGHLAAKKTVDRITSSFHWPGVVGDVTRFCRSCDMSAHHT